MSSWKDILKEDWRERLKRIEEANKKSGIKNRGIRGMSKTKRQRTGAKGGEGASRKKISCDMCGKLMHVRNVREGSLDTGTNYCKQCAKARGI
jgi:hypothetical protein